ncbi:NIPSNAP family protein [Rudanella lutea]|uniref:NIPSNAP family protein n=1 Tax=Rudanella lutea TaxID=451374 RepID=UPI0003637979|nr:NIPSNAP family protein [Rudanella lutea]
MLRFTTFVALFLLTALTVTARPSAARPDRNGEPTAKPSDRLYEIRIYYPTPGKYAEIVDRFRQYTTKLFEKHGMENIGYWTPTDTTNKQLVYILAYPDKAARDASWKAFGSDPAWKEVVAKTEARGKLVAKVDQIFMKETDFSPKVSVKAKSPARTFEMRTYTAAPGKMPNLLDRFRNHTLKLFKKHGMTNVAYFLTTEPTAPDANGQPRLVYFLAHEREAAGKASFDAFRKDPKWLKAKGDSEKDGPITSKVESLYLVPTDYSPMK